MKNILVFFCIVCLWTFSVYGEEEELETVKYTTPVPSGDVHFAEPFDAEDAIESWTLSKADKEGVESEISKYNGRWSVEAAANVPLDGDTGLVLKDKARHHAISTTLDKPFVFEDKPFVLQYEVNFQEGIECGGAYIKLLTQTDDLKLSEFHDHTPYTIMFGPDKCGEDYKLHFIFRHKNPLTGEFEEKHAPKPSTNLQGFYTDKKSHLYTLVLNPDNTFQVFVDQKVVGAGDLLKDMSPPVNPPKEIEDANDVKPSDWDERETIPDETAVKPDDWDEDAPAEIPDPKAEMPEGWLESEPLFVDDFDATQPEDWDEDIDGEWEAPQIDNPACSNAPGCGVWEPPTIPNPEFKGKWRAPHISNPAYKGIWKPRMIPNPDYFEDNHPFQMSTIGALGLELWSMSNEIMFDNILITHDKSVADDYASRTWALKNEMIASNEPGLLGYLMNAAEERPWLYLIYILVIVLPAVLIISLCCRSSTKSDAEAKKTDAVSPDDPHDSAEDEDESAEAEEEAKSENNSQQEEQSQEEGDEEEEAAADGADGDVASEKEEVKKEEEIEADTKEQETGDIAATRKSPRRRKPRVQD